MSAALRIRAVPLLVAINIVVFFFWLFPTESRADFMIQNFLVSWTALTQGRWWTLLTSVFSHNLFIHIFLNMFVLQNFGGVIEEVIGSKSFLKFYLIAGIFSSLCHAFVSAWILGRPEIPALGASGAISGVILIFSFIFPREKILLLGIVPIPALFGALLFIGLDLWGLIEQAGGGGLPIGHGAHLGGAFAGWIYYFFFLRSRLRKNPVL